MKTPSLCLSHGVDYFTMVAKRVEKHIKSVIFWFPGCFELASLTLCETLYNSLNQLANCGGTRTLSRTFGKMCSSQSGLLIDKKRVAMQQQQKGKHETPRGKT